MHIVLRKWSMGIVPPISLFATASLPHAPCGARICILECHHGKCHYFFLKHEPTTTFRVLLKHLYYYLLRCAEHRIGIITKSNRLPWRTCQPVPLGCQLKQQEAHSSECALRRAPHCTCISLPKLMAPSARVITSIGGGKLPVPMRCQALSG
jgi:hypothetical protein